MKSFLAYFLMGIQVVNACAQADFKLMWAETFDSTRLDASRWNNHYSWGRCILNNHETQYYTDGANMRLKDGTLIITGQPSPIRALADSGKPADYIMADSLPNLRIFKSTSGMICSRQKFHYGKFEMRCKLPKGRGGWPAFWLYGGSCGEIDIFEKTWKFHHSINNNYHFDSAGVSKEDFQFTNLPERNTFSRRYHTYTLEWTPDTIRWFIDSKLVRSSVHHYNCGMELIVNLALASDSYWGVIPKHGNWKRRLSIDHIKVWQWARNRADKKM